MLGIFGLLSSLKYLVITQIKNDCDAKYFDSFNEQDPFYPPEKPKKKRKDVNYPGYTYNRDLENPREGLLQALEVLEAVKKSSQNIDEVNLV